MRRYRLSSALLLLLSALALPCIAQERGSWRPASKTAQSITGDVTFNGDRMTINFFSLAVAEIRLLKPAEVSSVFDPAVDSAGSDASSSDASAGVGHLYRISIPGDRRFLHKNTLCGSDETQWMATYVSGKRLEVAFFSNAAPPVFTAEALSKSENLCGTYSYVR